ncbi:hypothetical protein MNB_SV-5-1711 [hydrothermal vent metagenome]|uniref:Uncharacterized protein n=1 Tax=hydrothermal vent metagenome TaxID=652676 RepID=A0A1W1EBI2_9ZZZZ
MSKNTKIALAVLVSIMVWMLVLELTEVEETEFQNKTVQVIKTENPVALEKTK